YVYEVIEIDYSAPDPSGSGSGTHRIMMSSEGMSNYHLLVIANTGSAISIAAAGFTGDASETPSAITQQYMLMKEGVIIATNDLPLNCKYTNGTDVSQTGTRTLKFLLKVYREAV
ncbi:unnamed protein product, partial [marine sediment metagenome]